MYYIKMNFILLIVPYQSNPAVRGDLGWSSQKGGFENYNRAVNATDLKGVLGVKQTF